MGFISGLKGLTDKFGTATMSVLLMTGKQENSL
jgi:hypothetical protein